LASLKIDHYRVEAGKRVAFLQDYHKATGWLRALLGPQKTRWGFKVARTYRDDQLGTVAILVPQE
jgi:hypothetical protein